jgi:hypothetical protein
MALAASPPGVGVFVTSSTSVPSTLHGRGEVVAAIAHGSTVVFVGRARRCKSTGGTRRGRWTEAARGVPRGAAFAARGGAVAAGLAKRRDSTRST